MMKDLRTLLVIVVFSFCVVVPTAFAETITAPDKADIPQRVINVRGTCVASLTPDRASITATALARDALAVQPAAQDVHKRYESLRKKLAELQLKDMRLDTVSYSMTPLFRWERADKPGGPDRQVPDGFEARLSLKIDTQSIDKMGELMALLAVEGLQDIGAFQTYVSAPVLRAAEANCLKDAVKNAKDRAAEMADAAGARLGPVISLQEGAGYPIPIPVLQRGMMMEKAMMATSDAMPAPSVETSAQEITVNVSAQFSLIPSPVQ